MIAYLDTHVVVWLAQNTLQRFSKAVIDQIDASDLRISPIVLLELSYLFEIRRIVQPPEALRKQLEVQIGLKVCTHPFTEIVETALSETWTRDPFDRLIVAHARVSGLANLITADEEIRDHYVNAVWF